jgi:type IV pilus assembly protein PilM
VESKKIPDNVKYEARQQIPFALEDVVWDYQQMAGGSEEDGFALETEVGLFAMKRDQVFRALKPFEDAGIEVDIIQLTPLTIYNYTVFDQMQDLPPADQYDPENPPESVVVLSLGTDTTDLVITNGYRVWQRSVPLGGSHFTKALTKELRLTFAKAEHLKKNATQAEDPKAVFQAMRPIFNDLLTEIQRSIGYFTSIDRGAKIGRVIALGNAMRLPGLQKYLSQNLGYPVAEVQKYRGIEGEAVAGAPAFKDNLLSFAVCYGLVLQGLGKAKLATNLLPSEIVTDRLIRDKKPWAVAMVAALMLGCAVNFLGHWRAWNSVDQGKFKEAMGKAEQVETQAKSELDGFEAAKAEFKATNDIGASLVGNVDGRLLWLEMLEAVDQCLPSDLPDKRASLEIPDRDEIHIQELDCEYFADLATWYSSGISARIKEDLPAAVAPAADQPPAAPVVPGASPPPGDPSAPAIPPAAAAAPAVEDPGPSGPGWVIQLHGYHYHNTNPETRGSVYVRDRLIKNLREAEISLPGKDGKLTKMPIKDLGIGYPVIVKFDRLVAESIPDPNEVEAPKTTKPGIPAERKTLNLQRFNFYVQFAWKPTPLSKRLDKEIERAKAKAGGALADTAAGNN